MNTLFIEILIFLPSILGILLIGTWALNNFVECKSSILDELIFGILIFSSILSVVYYFTNLDIGYVGLFLSLISLIANYYKIPFLIKKFKNYNFSFVIFYILILFLYLFPSYENILDVLNSGGILFAHIDFFSHTSIIEQIKHQPSIHNTQILFFNEKIPFYHYGIYIFPALLARLFQLSGSAIALWVMIPLGILILCKGLFELVGEHVKCDKFCKILFCLAVLIIADTSRSLYINNSLFDVPYLIIASPGALFGVGIIMYYLKFTRNEKEFNFKFFFLVLFLLLEYRVLYIPLFFIYSFYSWALVYRKINLYLLLFITLLIIGFLNLVGNQGLFEFYKFMLSFVSEENNFFSISENRILIALQILITVLGGGLLLLFIFTSLLVIINYAFHRKIDNLIISFYALILSYFIILLIPFPNLNGDSSEFIQRPFLFLNIFSSLFLVCYLSRNLSIKYFTPLLILPFIFIQLNNFRPYGFPVDHPWHISSYKVDINPSIIEVSNWLKENNSNSVYVYHPINRLSYSQYPEAIMTAISGMPAFLSRVGFYLEPTIDSKYKKTIDSRLNYLDALLECQTGQNIPTIKLDKNLYVVSEKIIACLSPVFSKKNFHVYLIAN